MSPGGFFSFYNRTVILLLDNYDSFVHNLARYFAELGCATHVVRNDCITVDEIKALNPEAIVLSPGPCGPMDAGISVELVRTLNGNIPLLGVCLGHQAIAAAYGGMIVRAPEPVHGRTSLIQHNSRGLFAGLPNPFRATRYHSLIADEATLPPELEVTARSDDRLVMAFQHRTQPVFGVQFHPESVLTQSGHVLLANFLVAARMTPSVRPPGELPAQIAQPDWYAEEPLRNQPRVW